MTTLFSIWTKQPDKQFTRLFTDLALCDAEMVAVCLGIEQKVFTAYADNESQSLLGPHLPQKNVAIYKNVFPFDVPALPLEEQIPFQRVPEMKGVTISMQLIYKNGKHRLQPMLTAKAN